MISCCVQMRRSPGRSIGPGRWAQLDCNIYIHGSAYYDRLYVLYRYMRYMYINVCLAWHCTIAYELESNGVQFDDRIYMIDCNFDISTTYEILLVGLGLAIIIYTRVRCRACKCKSRSDYAHSDLLMIMEYAVTCAGISCTNIDKSWGVTLEGHRP